MITISIEYDEVTGQLNCRYTDGREILLLGMLARAQSMLSEALARASSRILRVPPPPPPPLKI